MDKEQGQKIAFAGAVSLIAEPAMQLAHFGGPGVIAGLAAGAVAYLIADEVQQSRQQGEGEDPPSPAPRKKRALPDRPSLAKRLFVGKSIRGGVANGSQPAATPDGLPQRSPTFTAMRHLIKSGWVILGFDGQKFISGEAFSQVVNIAIIGLPRHGKSTCLRFHLAQALVHNAIIRGWDTHGDVAGEFGDYLSIAETVPAILADCAWIDRELERRAELFKRYRKHDSQAEREWSQTRPLVYIIDEFFLLLSVHIKKQEDRDIVTDTLLNLIAGASKYKCRVVLSGQALPANVFGEQASSVRDIIDTKYAFASEDRQARMIGIDEKAIKELLPRIAGENIRGYSILAGGPLVANKIISLPDTTFQDIQALLEERGDTDQFEGDDEELPEGISAWHLEQIAQAYQADWPLPDIADLLQMDIPTFKAAWEIVRTEIAPAGQRAPLERLPDTDAGQPDEPVKLMPRPAVTGRPKADYPDAVRVWNEIGEEIGRGRLQKALHDRGFECSDDLAKQLLARIKKDLEKQSPPGVGGVGGAGGVGGEAGVSL